MEAGGNFHEVGASVCGGCAGQRQILRADLEIIGTQASHPTTGRFKFSLRRQLDGAAKCIENIEQLHGPRIRQPRKSKQSRLGRPEGQ